MAAFQHPYPGFLEEVLGQFTISRKINQMPEQPVVILLNQAVEQVGIPATQAASDLGVLMLHPGHEIAGRRVHATHEYGPAKKKDANPPDASVCFVYLPHFQ